MSDKELRRNRPRPFGLGRRAAIWRVAIPRRPTEVALRYRGRFVESLGRSGLPLLRSRPWATAIMAARRSQRAQIQYLDRLLAAQVADALVDELK